MKITLFLIFFLLFFNCNFYKEKKIINKNYAEIIIKLPLGDSKAINFSFPMSWGVSEFNSEFSVQNINDMAMNKLSDFNYEFYQSLDTNRIERKILSVNYFQGEILSFKENESLFKKKKHFYIDSVSYYCGTIFKNTEYTVVLYKDRGMYDEKAGGELCICNYVNLVCLDKNNRVVDHLTIMLYSHCLYDWKMRSFHIDEKLNITLVDIEVPEGEPIKFSGRKKYKFNMKGNFVETKN